MVVWHILNASVENLMSNQNLQITDQYHEQMKILL